MRKFGIFDDSKRLKILDRIERIQKTVFPLSLQNSVNIDKSEPPYKPLINPRMIEAPKTVISKDIPSSLG